MPKKRPAGSGSVYRPKHRGADGVMRPQTVWWIAYRVRGKLVRESARTTVKTEAERTLRARTAAVDAGRISDPTAHQLTLADLRTLVATDYKNNGRSSAREVKRAFDRLEEHFGATTRARSIDAAQVDAYKAARLEARAAHATINRELAMLRRGFRLAVRLGRLAARPDFSLLTEDNARRGFFEVDQLDAVCRHLPEHFSALVRFLYWTGWRKGEALSLEWRQVDRKAQVIRIEDTKNRTPRTVPYGALPVLVELIEQQWHASQAMKRDQGRLVSHVFFRPDGRPIRGDDADLYPAWREARKKAGLPGRILHDLRRTAARNMLRAGIQQPVAMQIGGWKTDSVFRRYAIVDEVLIGEGMAKLAKLDQGR